ncbi:hypothetical protein LTR78_004634 [Recurvomyces mirabilis]|uniref:SMP domain-containing protein n=1 Tax=Recurvomyces mirabilis TaxID=574656 RepID=A0AAE1C2I4_9PEZI|nr:hypothetical protein LTR78_004634 [Recurvomyces mirabilis]KAK5152873.1 hypothetical protein LTS14_007980 [Recurvomyces mirabilis]
MRSFAIQSVRSLRTIRTTSASEPFLSTRSASRVSTPASQAISETAKQEGGTVKGSTSAQMQSEVGKQQNFEQAAQEVGSKMQNAPDQVTQEDAAYIHSREGRVLGRSNPPPGSITSEAEALAAANEGRPNTGNASQATAPGSNSQSAQDRSDNFEKASAQVGQKMATDPESVTKGDGDLLHSREQRAFGTTSKGGIASQAQSLARENQEKGTA